jgi:hypothetical protein
LGLPLFFEAMKWWGCQVQHLLAKKKKLKKTIGYMESPPVTQEGEACGNRREAARYSSGSRRLFTATQ